MSPWRTPKISEVRPILRHDPPWSPQPQPRTLPEPGPEPTPTGWEASSTAFVRQSFDFSPALEEGPLSPLSSVTPSPGINTPLTSPGERSRQSQMESQMTKLQDQVQLLTDMMQRTSTGKDGALSDRENAELRRENAALRRTLADSDGRLEKLQEGVVQLQEEYRQESEELQQQVAQLAELLTAQAVETDQLKTSCSRLERSKKDLESYLDKLPSEEEHEEVVRRLQIKEEECGKLANGKVMMEKEIFGCIKTKKELMQEVKELKEKNVEQAFRLTYFEELISAHEQRRAKANEMSQDVDAQESVLCERQQLSEENNRLKKYILITQKKQKKEDERQSRQIDALTQEVRQEKEASCRSATLLSEEQTTSSFLRQDLTRSKARVRELEQELCEANQRFESLHVEGEKTGRLEDTNAILGVELSRCVEELRALGTSAQQLADGNDPNVSMLLGIQKCCYVRAAPVVNPTYEERCQRLQNQLSEVKQVRADIGQIRDKLSEKYADSLATNMTSCITQ